MTITTTVFTACDRAYEAFVLPYLSSVLFHNPDAVVEICIEDTARFNASNQAALGLLSDVYANRWLIRESAKSDWKRPQRVRFTEVPQLSSQYTYIGDIDILILEHITPQHVAAMKETGLPYSNAVRPGTSKLTGLHFTLSEAYYPQAPVRLHMNDEASLYELVKGRGHPLPGPEHTFRPMHGYHMTLNRRPLAPKGEPAWGIRNPKHLEAYLAFRASDEWQSIYRYLHPGYKMLITILESSLQATFLDKDIYNPIAVHRAVTTPIEEIVSVDAAHHLEHTAGRTQSLQFALRTMVRSIARKARRRRSAKPFTG